ncbi:hypothetical protein WMY93_031801 [Mugilogobius chulae]|uniref:L1 transposable element RRM domain-containing protein n=1 Tax=Mugilogobius chulae TaxID=88201 RepID=A0AAW0MFG9_9GOBI
MGKRDKREKNATEEHTSEENATPSQAANEGANAMASMNEESTAANLALVLGEIRDFRKEFQDFKSDLISVNKKLTEAETRIAKVEDRVQNVEHIMLKMLKVMGEQEDKLMDQESRARRKNLRLYNVPEEKEGSSMTQFVEKVLKDCLDMPQATSLDIERAHRALAPRQSGNGEEKPLSILIRFARFTTKEEVLRKAWSKKTVFLDGRRIYFDQDYAPAILQKRKDYVEAKRVLKRQNIRFQTPYPAKMRVFYQDGTVLYQSAEEATADMNARGFPVTKVTSKERLTEQLTRSAWKVMGMHQQRDTEEQRERIIREKLQVFRRRSPPTTED